MHICNRCTRNFASKRDLGHHVSKRQKLCYHATHYCSRCEKGFSCYQSLWKHIQRCRKFRRVPLETGISKPSEYMEVEANKNQGHETMETNDRTDQADLNMDMRI